MLTLADPRQSLPPVWSADLLPSIREANAAAGRSIVVLDDDPTGTQTVYDIPVLTEWTAGALTAELERDTPLFHVLTNSRSLPGPRAAQLAREIGGNLKRALAATQREVTVISRSDSTLRGHFPGEVDALVEELGQPQAVRIIAPFFEEGGRLTIDDTHYVADGGRLVPAAETPFARDASFGFTRSNLREWVAEKTGGRIAPESVRSITLNDLRKGGPGIVAGKLSVVPAGGVCVINAVAMRDMEVFVAGLLEAEKAGKQFIARTAASYVRARAALEKRPLLDGGELRCATGNGGLIVVGSHVPKTTAQLKQLLAANAPGPQPVELAVEELIGGKRRAVIDEAVRRVNVQLSRGHDVALHTSREVVTGADAGASLEIGAQISTALVEIVQRLAQRPAFMIAKGGITSSDVATHGLAVKRAMVRGQILPGIPVWRLGDESRFPGMNYVVFPGNVGGDGALREVYEKLTGSGGAAN
ncbi:MAG TPA: hypothetical protein DCY13_19835 [Verrucomicrobiales bacterium]|nr:hypothetical protein [Verrucomicrobiales bacterium]